MQPKGKIYGILFIAIIAICVFFFSSKFWLPDDRTVKNLNYDQVLTVGDWMIRFQDASYNDASETMTINVLQKAQLASDTSYKLAIYYGDMSNKKKLPFQLSHVMDKPNLQVLSIQKIPADYYYITIEVIVPQDDGTVSSTSGSNDTSEDVFGTNSSLQQQEQPITAEVHIDYRQVRNIKSTKAKES